MATARRWPVVVAGFSAFALVGTDGRAWTSLEVLVGLAGPRSIRVEIAAGIVNPCDSSWNVPLYRGWLNPGDVIALQSPKSCICWRQTYDNFPDANWSTSRITCKTGVTCRNKTCTVDPDPVLRLYLVSTEPHN
ncbi:MAG TPA: hypothetical protein VKT80_14435 [Chloroflexota bacterium]|nr:hypothetical protein [Chloroflexota bacterium]